MPAQGPRAALMVADGPSFTPRPFPMTASGTWKPIRFSTDGRYLLATDSGSGNEFVLPPGVSQFDLPNAFWLGPSTLWVCPTTGDSSSPWFYDDATTAQVLPCPWQVATGRGRLDLSLDLRQACVSVYVFPTGRAGSAPSRNSPRAIGCLSSRWGHHDEVGLAGHCGRVRPEPRACRPGRRRVPWLWDSPRRGNPRGRRVAGEAFHSQLLRSDGHGLWRPAAGALLRTYGQRREARSLRSKELMGSKPCSVALNTSLARRLTRLSRLPALSRFLGHGAEHGRQ
jgi:hypothetical protein